MAADRPLLSVTEAAERLGITRARAYRWVAAGQFPGAVQLAGGHWLVKKAVLDAWLTAAGEDPAGSFVVGQRTTVR